MRSIFFVASLFVFSCTISQSTFTSGGKIKPVQANMDIRHYTIALDVDVSKKSIDGYTIIDFDLLQPSDKLLFDLLDSFNVKNVFVNGKKSAFDYHNNAIAVDLPAALPAGRVSVKVVYDGKPHVAIRPPWDDGFIWATDSSGNPWIAITAEGVGCKLYFPGKDHPSDEPDEGVDMIITVPKAL